MGHHIPESIYCHRPAGSCWMKAKYLSAALITSVERLSPSLLDPFSQLLLLYRSYLLSAAFLFKKRKKGKNPEAKNDIKSPERLHRDYCLKMPALQMIFLSLSLFPPSPLLSPNFTLIFFQLRGADSPDTIIQLRCGSTTVAQHCTAKVFPTYGARAKPGVPLRQSCRTSQLQAKEMAEACCAARQLCFKQLSYFPLVSFTTEEETDGREECSTKKVNALYFIPNKLE